MTAEKTTWLCSVIEDPIRKSRLKDRLEKRSAPASSGCILWTGGMDRKGYGFLRIGKRATRPHRVAFLISGGVLTEDRNWVLHSCHVPACINPDHLHAGNHKENEEEKVLADRQARGQKIGNSRLSPEKAAMIRDQFATGIRTIQSIATEHGVARQTISAVISGRTWKH